VPLNEAIRERLRESVAAICDADLRERLWLRGERKNADEPTFDDVVLFIVDELATSNPTELVGHALLDDRELAAFLALSAALDELVEATGDRLTYENAVATGALWQNCLASAQALADLIDA